MTSPSSQEFESYVPVYDAVPDKWEEARPFIVENFKKISNAVNIRTIGWLLDEELLSGQAFIPGANLTGTSQQYRQVLRKVIDFGALPNTGTKTVPHGITVDSNFTLIHMWASTTDPVAFQAFPIPFDDPTAPTSTTSVYMNATDVIISTGSNRTSFTRTFVFIEYIQEI